MPPWLASAPRETSAEGELDAGLYTPGWNNRTYDAVLDTARELLSRGESVIADASWSDVARGKNAASIAESTSSALVSFLLTTPVEIADARARARASSQSDALTGALRVRFAAWPGAIHLDATEPVSVLAARVLEELGGST